MGCLLQTDQSQLCLGTYFPTYDTSKQEHTFEMNPKALHTVFIIYMFMCAHGGLVLTL